MSQQAKSVIENGAYTKPEIIAEVVYILKGVYKATRTEIQSYIKTLLHSIQCTDSHAVEYAIDLYAVVTMNFVNCLLVAYHALNGESVFSFDKKVNRHLNQL